MDHCGLEASLGYRASFRTAKATQRNPNLKNKQKINYTNKKVGHRMLISVKDKKECLYMMSHAVCFLCFRHWEAPRL